MSERWYRSSLVGLADKHCPAAMVFERLGTPRDRGPMPVGTGVHQILEHVAANPDRPAAEIADRVQVELIATGRSFEGGPPEFLSPDQAQVARDLAMLYLDVEEIEFDAVERHPELSVSVDRDWKICKRGSKEERWRQIFDLVLSYTEEDHQGELVRVIHPRDYKGWNGDESWFDTTQGRSAAVLAPELDAQADIIRREVTSYRTRRSYTDDLDLRFDEDLDKLIDYRRGLELTMEALDKLPNDPEACASPGAGCLKGETGCPFIGNCGPALRYFAALKPPWQTLEDTARLWTLAQALGKRAGADLRKLLKSGAEPIKLSAATAGDHKIPAGIVGLVPSGGRKVTANAPHWIAREWVEKVVGEKDLERAQLLGGAIEGLLRASKLGVTSAKALIYHIKKTVQLPKEEFEVLRDRCIEPAPTPRLELGAWKEST